MRESETETNGDQKVRRKQYRVRRTVSNGETEQERKTDSQRVRERGLGGGGWWWWRGPLMLNGRNQLSDGPEAATETRNNHGSCSQHIL